MLLVLMQKLICAEISENFWASHFDDTNEMVSLFRLTLVGHSLIQSYFKFWEAVDLVILG